MSKLYINIGATKTGKTFLTKKMLDRFNINNIHVYDVNNEYQEYYKKSFVKFDEFLNKVKTLTDSVIVFEEATIFFTHKNCNATITDLCVRKRHARNHIILNFHSLRKVPAYVYDFADYVILKKTNDLDSFVKSKFDPKIYGAYQRVKQATAKGDRYFYAFVDMYD